MLNKRVFYVFVFQIQLMDTLWLIIIVIILSLMGALLMRHFLPCMATSVSPISRIGSELPEMPVPTHNHPGQPEPAAERETQVRFREPISETIVERAEAEVVLDVTPMDSDDDEKEMKVDSSD